MRHSSQVDKAIKRYDEERIRERHRSFDSKPELTNPKAYSRFKAFSTDYGSGRKCSYGNKQRACDPGCLFWLSCVNGRQSVKQKGDDTHARSDTENQNNL